MLGCGISQKGDIRDLSLPRFIKIDLLIRVDVTKLFSIKPDRCTMFDVSIRHDNHTRQRQ